MYVALTKGSILGAQMHMAAAISYIQIIVFHAPPPLLF